MCVLQRVLDSVGNAAALCCLLVPTWLNRLDPENQQRGTLLNGFQRVNVAHIWSKRIRPDSISGTVGARKLLVTPGLTGNKS